MIIIKLSHRTTYNNKQITSKLKKIKLEMVDMLMLKTVKTQVKLRKQFSPFSASKSQPFEV